MWEEYAWENVKEGVFRTNYLLKKNNCCWQFTYWQLSQKLKSWQLICIEYLAPLRLPWSPQIRMEWMEARIKEEQKQPQIVFHVQSFTFLHKMFSANRVKILTIGFLWVFHLKGVHGYSKAWQPLLPNCEVGNHEDR